MKRRPGLKTCKNTEDTIKNDKEDKDGIPLGGIPSEKSKILLVRHFAGTGGFSGFRGQFSENS